MRLALYTNLSFMLVATLCGCGSEKESGKPLDLVGGGAGGKSQEADAKVEASPSREINLKIDLIEDHLFRLERDGWGLRDPASHISLERVRTAGLDLVLTAVPPPSGANPGAVMESSLATLEKMVADSGGEAVLVSSLLDARRASAAGKVPLGILLEGADGLAGKGPEDLYDLKRRGLMAVGLVSPRGNSFGDAAVSPSSEGGLTDAGSALVSACRDLGLLIDLTHASEKTFWDVLVSEGSLVAVTHSASRAVREHPRNLTDLQILALSRSGGVMGLIFNPDFIQAGQGSTEISALVEHVLHVKKIGALDALALGTDFGGIRPPRGLDDVSKLPALADALRTVGLDDEEIRGVFGGNAARLLEAVEAKQGAAENGRSEPLRPISVECESVFGEYKGAPQQSCDGKLVEGGLILGAAARQRMRLSDMRHEPVRIEIFGDPGTPWQVEAQNLEGKVLIRRGVALDATGHGTLPLPSGRNLTRVFISPTRESNLREAVLWGR